MTLEGISLFRNTWHEAEYFGAKPHHISSLPKKEQLSTALQILQQSLAQRATLLQQQHNLTTQMDIVNAQLMQYQLENNDLRANYEDLQSLHNKLLTGSTFLTSYMSDPL